MTRPPKPTAEEVWPRNIPQDLKEVAGWVMWKWWWNGKRWTKPPYNIDAIKIDEGNPDNWADFSTALQTYQRGGFDGIGLSMNAMDRLAGVDLDHCVDGGKIAPWAEAIVKELGSYAEVSPSGTGLRVFGYGKIRSPNGRKKDDIEMYDSGRYLTATGRHLDFSPFAVMDFDEALNRLHNRIWPEVQETTITPDRPDEIGEDLAERFAALCDDDPIFREKYYSPASVGDRSDIEFNLCAKLYEEGFSASEIRSLMDSSPQEKWRSRDDKYREDTIQNAIRSAASPKTTRRVRKKEDPAKLLEILEGKLSEDPDVIQDPTVKKMLATYRRLDAVGYESLLKRVGIRGDLKKALVSDLKRINDDDGEKTVSGPSMATRIAELAIGSGATFWRNPEGDPYATIPASDGHLENHPLKSRAIRDWLSGLLYREENRVPKGSAVADAISVLGGKARFDGEVHPVYVRFAECEEKIYLDLGGDEWRAVEIDADGWRVIPSTEVPVKFRRAKGFMELPEPTDDGSLEDLRKILNIPVGSDWMLIKSWLMQSFRPRGPYPILIVDGEQGSGKSWLGRILRGIVDPNKSPLRQPPQNTRDLMIAASNSWLVIYDNLSGLPKWLGNSLCIISTGGGLSTRELYTDDEEALFDVMRPIILNSITELTNRPDLLDRSILISLPRIKAGDRKTEKEIESELERIRPGVLGAILDAVSCGLKELPNMTLEDKPRMADFAVWAAACGEALGWDDGEFMETFKKNQKVSKKALIENDVFATALYKFIMSGKDDAVFENTISFLLTALEGRANLTPKTLPSGWPKTARWASGKIRELAPALRDVGVDVAFTRDASGVRMIRLEKIPASKQEELVSDESDEENGELGQTDATDASDAKQILASEKNRQQKTAVEVSDAIDAKKPNFNLDRNKEKGEGEKKEREKAEEKDGKISVNSVVASGESDAYRKNPDANPTLKNPSVGENSPSSVDTSDGEEIDAILDAMDIRDALESQGKRITFGNVEACLEAKNGGYVEPSEVKKILNAFSSVGYITTKDGAMVAGHP